MPTFHFVAVDRKGNRQTGQIEASSKDIAVAILGKYHNTIIELDPMEARIGRRTGLPKLRNKSAKRSWTLLLGKFANWANLIDAGLTINDILQIEIASSNATARQMSDELLQSVRAGQSFTASVKGLNLPQTNFTHMYLTLLDAAERTASFATAFRELAQFSDMQTMIRRKLRATLAYPLFLAAASLVLLTTVFTVFLPSIRAGIEQSPAAANTTSYFMNSTDLFQSYYFYPYLVILCLMLVVAVRIRNNSLQTELRIFMMNIPFLGRALSHLQLASYLYCLAIMIRSGLQIPDAIKLSNTVWNDKQSKINAGLAEQHVRSGGTISDALSRIDAIPAHVIEIIRTGETSSRLPHFLTCLADNFKTDSNESLSRLASLVGPLITVVVGIVIAAVAFMIVDMMLSVTESVLPK